MLRRRAAPRGTAYGVNAALELLPGASRRAQSRPVFNTAEYNAIVMRSMASVARRYFTV